MALADPSFPTTPSLTLLAGLRSDEGGAALVAAVRLALLRDLRGGMLLGAGSLDELRRRSVPMLDATSARTLLHIADNLVSIVGSPGGAAALASLGLARLAVAASAPAEVREALVWAGLVPLTEMRRHAREGRETIEARRLRARRGTLAGPPIALPDEVVAFDPALLAELRAAPEPVRVEAAQAAVSELRRSWERAGKIIWQTGTIVAALDPDVAADAELLATLDMDRLELDRLAGPVRLFGSSGPECLGRLGIGTLRAIAAVSDPERREALVAQASDPAAVADELVEAAGRADRHSAAPAVPSVVGPTAVPGDEPDAVPVRDDPDAVCSFSLWLSDDEEPGPRFADALPPSFVEQLILRTTRPGDLVVDPMAGSGVSVRACARLGRRIVASDLIDPPVDPAVGVADARTTPLPPETALVLLHPPVPLEVVYSERYGGRRRSGDFSGLDPEGHRRALGELLTRIGAEMRPGASIVLVLRPSRFDGRFWDWPRIGAELLEKSGLTICERIVAPMGPARRAEAERRGGLRARRRTEALPVIWEAVIARRGGLR